MLSHEEKKPVHHVSIVNVVQAERAVLGAAEAYLKAVLGPHLNTKGSSQNIDAENRAKRELLDATLALLLASYAAVRPQCEASAFPKPEVSDGG